MSAKEETKRMWNLNYPKETALPEKPFRNENQTGSLSVQDLLDPSYPDPIKQAILHLENLGYDVEGLRLQHIAMKHYLKTNAQIFRDILELAQARAGTFGVGERSDR